MTNVLSDTGPATGPTGGGRKWWKRIVPLAAVITIVLMAASFMLEVSSKATTTPASQASAEPATQAAPPLDQAIAPVSGATRIVNGIPVGYSDNTAGARAAATNYLTLLYGRTATLAPTKQRQLLDTIAAPDQAAALAAQITPGTEAARTALAIDANGNPPPGKITAYQLVPVRYTVVSITPDAAKISVWWMGLVGVADPSTTFPVSDVWGTDTVSLLWLNGDWKWASVKHASGPAPVPGNDPAKDTEIAKALQTGTVYGYGV